MRHGPVLLILALTGCSTSNLDSSADLRPSLHCVDDSKECIEKRQGALKGMMADHQRKWVREPATPHSYASGVRLFAFKGRKRELTCDELAIGRREAEVAPVVLRGNGAAGLSPAQVSRGTMLASEVHRELNIEMKRRCRA
jgi:hypothetical protein